MTTKYPTSIDGYSEIRVTRDGIDEIVSGDHNDLRSAVLAIENTLGTNPQGPFGTVKARLNDAYSNIESHVLGNPPRHQDDVIMSPVRAGTIPTSAPLKSLPYSLASGTLSTQISKILEFLNDSLMYAGSGAITFADGYSLGFSLIRNSITQIVNQLGGGTTGTQKISGATITGTNFSVSAGTLRTQLVSLLNLIDAFGNTTGGGLVGASTFTTTNDGKYSFSGTDVQSQINEAGSFLDEAASFREKIFNAFVVSGMAVSGSGGIATVAAGYVAANGRMLRYAGGSVSVPDSVTSYIYAYIENGSVVIANSVAIPTRAINPVILLQKITRSGATWTTSLDLRRYGMFSNDKNYLTVGNTPSTGKDGYGCDFVSLKSAVEYVKTLNNNTALIAPMKIILASDLTINSSSEMEILLNVDGLEIDGCGRAITTNVDLPLFKIEQNNITLDDIVLKSNLSSSGSALCLAHVANTISVTNLVVSNCKLLVAGSTAAPFFIRLGNTGASTNVSKTIISENIASVEKGGIEYVSTNKYTQVLRDSVITGNNIYQNTFSTTSYAGIKASIQCTLGDNIIKGGFDTGMLLAHPTQCRADGNVIIGYNNSIIYMNNGIAIWNDSAGQDNGCVISDNSIKGIKNYGIDCKAGAGSGAFISVYGNFIDNYYYVGTPSASMVAIRGRGAETWVVGNKITAPGTYGIQSCSHAVANQIYGISSVTGTSAAIQVSTSGESVIADNTINTVAGIGIDVNNNTNVVITGNALLGGANSTTGIEYIGSDCVVADNIISSYRSTAIQSTAGKDITISNNKIIDCEGSGITLNNCDGAIIVGNWLECPVGLGSTAIVGAASYSIIDGNYIANYGAGGGSQYAIKLHLGSSIDTSISNNVIKNLYSGASGAVYTPGGWSRLSVVGNVLDNSPGNGFHFGDATQVLCANNIISGDSTSTDAIRNFGSGSIVIGNMIDTYCTNSTDSAIYASAGASALIVANNHITACNGHGINLNGSSTSVVSGNYMNGATNSYYGIIGINEYSTISNNVIIQYGGLSGSRGISTNTGSGKIDIIGNFIYSPRTNMDYGIYLSNDIYYNVINNRIADIFSPVAKTAIHANNSAYCLISNNTMGCAQTGTAGDHAIKGVGNHSIVTNNFIDKANYYGIEIAGERCLCANNRIHRTKDVSIYCSDDYNSISNNVISEGLSDSIYLSSASYASITGNYIYQGSVGITVDASPDSLIASNYMYQAGDGVLAINSSHQTSIVGNYTIGIKNTISYEINTSGGNHCSIIGNRSMDDAGYGIFIDAPYTQVESNFVYSSGVDSIVISTSANYCEIIGNSVFDSAGYAFKVESSYANLNNNMVYAATSSGIYSTGSYSSISSNMIRQGSSHAIELTGNDLVVNNNIISSPTGDGIRASSAGALANSVVNGNYMINVSYGIHANATANQCNIANNFIKNCSGPGIFIGANDAVITSNSITAFSSTGIYIYGAHDCIINSNRVMDPAASPNIGINAKTSDGCIIMGNWLEGAGTDAALDMGAGVDAATNYIVLGNLSDGGATPSGFSGPPAGTNVISNWERS